MPIGRNVLTLFFLMVLGFSNAQAAASGGPDRVDAGLRLAQIPLSPDMPKALENSMRQSFFTGSGAYCADAAIPGLKQSEKGRQLLGYCKRLQNYLTIKDTFERCGAKINTAGGLKDRILGAALKGVNLDAAKNTDCTKINSMGVQLADLNAVTAPLLMSRFQDLITNRAVQSGTQMLAYYEKQFPKGGSGGVDPSKVAHDMNRSIDTLNQKAKLTRTGVKGLGPDLDNVEFNLHYADYVSTYGDMVSSANGLLFLTDKVQSKMGPFRKLNTGFLGTGTYGGLARIGTDDGHGVQYVLEQHFEIPEGAAGAKFIQEAAEQAKTKIRNEIALLQDMDRKKKAAESPLSGKYRPNADAYGDLKKLFNTNPAHVGAVLLENPELSYMACSVLESIQVNEKWDQKWDKAFTIGGWVLTGAGLVVGGAVVTAVLVGAAIPTAAVVAMTGVGAASTGVTGTQMYTRAHNAYVTYHRTEGAIATGGADAHSVQELNKAESDLNNVINSAVAQGYLMGINASAMLNAARVPVGLSESSPLAGLNRTKNLLQSIGDAGGLNGADQKIVQDGGNFSEVMADLSTQEPSLIRRVTQSLKKKSLEQMKSFVERFKTSRAGCGS